MPDEQIQDLDGPDPRTWPSNPDLWGLVQDLEYLDHVSELMDGRIAQDGMTGAYEEARRFLRAAGRERRETLALMLLSMYGIEPDEDAGASPYAAAGKPRAFGADTAPPMPGNLSLVAKGKPEVRWVRLSQIGSAGLTADQMLKAIEMASLELGIAMALQIIHGARWPEVYKAHGGHVRFDDDGEPCVPVT